MSIYEDDEETQLETQILDTQYEVDTQEQEVEDQEMDDIPDEESEPEEVEPSVAEIAAQSKKRVKRDPVELKRDPGKSLLPFSKVQRIIKADKEIPIVAKEATFLISLATEEFIKRLCEAGQQVANREKRTTVQHKDIAAVVRRVDEFLFLEEIMTWTSVEPPAKRPLKQKPSALKADGPTLLDQFVTSKKDADDGGDEDIIMNEDGTMVAGNIIEYDE